MVGGMGGEMAQGMLGSDNPLIKEGAELLMASPEPFFEGGRRCQDVIFTIFYLCIAGVVIGLGINGVLELHKLSDGHRLAGKLYSEEFTTTGVPALLLGLSVALLVGLVFLQMCRCMPTCMVYTALLLGPALMVGFAILAFILKAWIVGVVLGAIGLCLGACLLFCWKHLIPFTALLVETIAIVAQKHCSMIVISIFGGLWGAGWSIIAALAVFGTWAMVKGGDIRRSGKPNDAVSYGILFVLAVLTFWGSYVVQYVCHVANCGVFGRWYFRKDTAPIFPSLRVALTTSFGTVCFGALLIAVVRALETVANQMKHDDNIVVQIFGCILKCIIGCIGDIMEWLNGFLYVQVAMRGLSFCEAAKATFALCSWGNIDLLAAASLATHVGGMASLVCGLSALAVSLAYSWPYGIPLGQHKWDAFIVTWIIAVMSLIGGTIIGSAMMQVIESGACCLMVCFAEYPEGLQWNRPELYRAFSMRLQGDDGSAREMARY